MEFADKAKAIHGNKFDYSKVNYVSRLVKVEIVCRTHGSFFQSPSDHLRGKGCAACAKATQKAWHNKKLFNNGVMPEVEVNRF